MLLMDRLAMGMDALLIAALLALGFLGDRVPLPKGQDSLLILRSTPESVQPSLPRPPAPPAPAPEPVVPDRAVEAPEPPPAPKPGQLEWGQVQAALNRGKTFMGEARGTGDPGRKRAAYAEAEKAFKAALAGIETYRGVCPDPNPAVDDAFRNINMLITECHKSSPMDLH